MPNENTTRRLLLQEAGTNYATSVSALINRNPKFWNIYEHNVNKTTHLSYRRIFDSLNSGTVIINDEQTLFNYIACFGGHHYQKLQVSFGSLFRYIGANSTIDIIDYGCGQALATTVFYDFMRSSGINYAVKNITLIEPSLLSLKRGILHLNHFINHRQQNTEIKRNNKMLDDVTELDLSTDSSTIKLHLFSNILDVTTFDFNLLATKIKNTQRGINFFVCVSPYNTTAEQRILGFKNCFNHQDIPSPTQQIFKKAYNVQTKQWQDDYRITMCQRIFKCNFESATQRINTNFINDDLPF